MEQTVTNEMLLERIKVLEEMISELTLRLFPEDTEPEAEEE